MLLLFSITSLSNRYRDIIAGLAVAAKWFTAPVLGLIMIPLIHRKQWREVVQLTVTVIGISIAFAIPFLLSGVREFIDDITWEGRRGVDAWEIPLSLMRFAGLHYSPLIHLAVVGIAVIALAVNKPPQEADRPLHFVRSAVIVVALFAILANVFHHNYLGRFYSLLPLLFVRPASQPPQQPLTRPVKERPDFDRISSISV